MKVIFFIGGKAYAKIYYCNSCRTSISNQIRKLCSFLHTVLSMTFIIFDVLKIHGNENTVADKLSKTWVSTSVS